MQRPGPGPLTAGAQVQRWLNRPRTAPHLALIARALTPGAARWVTGGPRRPETPVIAVGGLALGGNGATPVTWALGQAMAFQGRSVALALRGYRGRLVRPERILQPDPGRLGDEVSLLAARAETEGIALWAGGRWPDLVKAASAHHELIIADGGLLSRSLARRLEVAVVDPDQPGRLWPAGDLKAPLSRAEQADLLWLHRRRGAPMGLADQSMRSSWSGRRPDVWSQTVVTGLTGPDGPLDVGWLQDRAVAALCAIGRPSAFLQTIEACGARVAWWGEGLDHRPLSVRSVEQAQATGLPVLITDKDAARWPDGPPPGLITLHTDLQVIAGHQALESMWPGG